VKDIYVAGAGMTQFGKQLERNVRSLAEEAVRDALADAGIGPEAIEYAFFSNAVGSLITGQACIPGQAALRHTGLLGIPIVNVENACASGSTAFSLACNTLAAGAADVAIVVGAEKLSHPDKARSFAAFSSGYDQEEPPTLTAEQQDGAQARSVACTPPRPGGQPPAARVRNYRPVTRRGPAPAVRIVSVTRRA